jgi:site-specific recombinase XerD
LLDEVAALEAWLAVRRDRSPFLFTSQKGGRLHRTQFFRTFQTLAKQAALPIQKRHPRILKYSLAAHLLAQKTDVTAISRMLGHRSMNSTLQYVKAIGLQNLAGDRNLPLLLTNLSPSGTDRVSDTSR